MIVTLKKMKSAIHETVLQFILLPEPFKMYKNKREFVRKLHYYFLKYLHKYIFICNLIL